jgi:CBS-domain-containing membrane protein
MWGEKKVHRLAFLDSNKRLVGIVTLGDLAPHTNYKLCGEVLGEKLPYLATWQTSKAKDSRGSPFVQHLSCDFILVFIVFRGAGAESL